METPPRQSIMRQSYVRDTRWDGRLRLQFGETYALWWNQGRKWNMPRKMTGYDWSPSVIRRPQCPSIFRSPSVPFAPVHGCQSQKLKYSWTDRILVVYKSYLNIPPGDWFSFLHDGWCYEYYYIILLLEAATRLYCLCVSTINMMWCLTRASCPSNCVRGALLLLNPDGWAK